MWAWVFSRWLAKERRAKESIRADEQELSGSRNDADDE